MQTNMQQNPQPQMMAMPNPQQMQPINQIYQVVQTNSTPNRCEKFSQWMTGSKNIPFMVFLIFMSNAASFIFNLLNDYVYVGPAVTYSSFAHFLFALFVWLPMSIKIEKNTSTVRYGYLYFVNCSLLSIFTISFPLSINRIWSFILFETLLIALSNKDKKIKFFFWKIGGKNVIILSILYHIFLSSNYFLSVVVTVIYTFAYQKYLINKFGVSNEKVERMENWCLINWLKNNLTTFTTIKEVLEKAQGQQQPLVQNSDVQNSNNSSFIPANMYPNYYSGVDPNMQQMQPMPPAGAIGTDYSNVNQPPQ